MSFFPAFLNMDNKKVLVVGGGKIAADKIEKLLEFTTDITIIAPQISPRTQEFIETHHLRLVRRPYEAGDVQGYFIAVVAVDDLELQKSIYEECHRFGTLCNAVDSTKYCDFIFPSYIKRGDLVVAFSTSGVSPGLAKYLRRAIERLIPTDIEEFLAKIKHLRQTLPKGKERMRLLDQKAKEYIAKHFKGEE